MIHLTGIKPSSPNIHIGNYISAIKPIIDNYNEKDEYYIQIADGHALTQQPNPEELKINTINLTNTLLAVFGDKPNIHIYRQSQIPEIFKLNWYLSCFTAKGLLNRNHTYKFLVQENKDKDKDDDKGIFMGIFNYPVLMASDILLFEPDNVPIGKDQQQHLELIIDIAEKMNYFYNDTVFKIPEYTIKENIILNSYDGRKMSKSYGNEIPLVCSEEELEKYIYKYKTNNKGKGYKKFEDETELSNLVKYICNKEHLKIYHNILDMGHSWKDIKGFVAKMIDIELKFYRWNFNELTTQNAWDFLYKKELSVKRIAQLQLRKIEKIIGLL